MNQQQKIKWGTIESFDNDACQAYLNWVIDSVEPNDQNLKGITWLLAHCHDGVTWGCLHDDQSWRKSSVFFPALCPCISKSNLLEIRLFGLEQEILIWRTENGFSGRRLFDSPETEPCGPCRPDDERMILLGSQVLEKTNDGFTHVRTKSGMEQVFSLEFTDKEYAEGCLPYLMVRHYFEQDDETGAVRVAASRLVNVFKEG